YIFGDHATGNIRDFPLIYSPKLFYPLKIDRQTGFLIPSAGYSSEFGTFVRENFFWAISYDKDITIGANAFTERGVHGVIEARYAVSPDSNIYLTADGINDDKSSVNTDGRWRYVSKSLINLPYGIEILADAYKISDYMYMRDFGKMGLYKGIYGDDNSYYQQYHIKWLTPWVEATAMYRANEMYNDTQTGYSYTLTERKPSLSLQKNRLDFELFNVDYLFLWDNVRYLNQYNYFNRQPDEIEYNYSRFFGRASIYRTFRLPLLRFTPRLIETYSHWQDFDYEVDVKLRNTSDFTFLRQSGNGYDRSMPIIELRADVNEIYKIYPDGARHGILNIFQYRFIQGLDQTGLPEYLPYDRFERNNTISWTVRNYLRFKSTWQADLSLTQAVYIDTNESLLPLEIRSNITKPSVFSNIFLLRYDYYAADNITYKSSDRFIALQDTVSLTVNSFILSGIYSYDKINYTEDYNTSLQMNASVTLGNVMVEGGVRWQAANDVLSMSGLEPVENTVSIKWIDQCWGLGFVYTTSKYKKVTPDSRELKREHMVELSLELKGMGESATRVFKSEVDYDN
ncbi:MAG: hypothetical protein LBH05_03110, partial [Deferribacteraceae bacterium]|nr:hypothetical protein [Deferribacteraceae bacterium]